MTKKKEKGNVCGIIGLSISIVIPSIGFIMGLIALGRKEPNKVFGILAIILSMFFAALWTGKL